MELARSVSIDWLSITFRDGLSVIHPSYLDKEYADDKPIHGYKLARKFKDGRRELTNPERPEMGTHVIYSGSALNNIRSKRPIETLLSDLMRLGAKATRIDIALDLHNSGFSLPQLYDDFEAGKCNATAKTAKEWRSSGGGYTVQIGSRTSNQLFRAYNKAAEQEVSGDWVRLELELKSHRAARAAFAISKNPDRMADLAVTIIRSIVDYPDNHEWGRHLSGKFFRVG